MPNRPDVPLVLLVLGLAPLVLLVLGLAELPLSLAFNASIWLWFGSTLAIFLYAAFWGFVVRRGMAVKLYRHQALGMSLVSLGMLAIFISVVIGGRSPLSFVFRYDFYGLLAFFWVDASMRASQDLDPLSRDSLRWSKLRYVLWGLSFAGIGVFLGYLALTGNYGLFANPPQGLTSTTVELLSVMPFLVPFIAGVVALPIAALRSRDRSFRRQLQWFALGLLLLFGIVGLSLLIANSGDILGPVSFPVTGYCFYRSTRALVPLSRISPD